MTQTPDAPGGSELPHSALVIPEWLWAGLLGGLAVAVVFWVRDLAVGELLHTPTVLGTALLEGVAAAREVEAAGGTAVVYHVLHVVAWVLTGFVAALLFRRAETDARQRWLPLAGLAIGLAAVGVADHWLASTALGRTPIWIGGIAGLAACGGFLAWRHPRALGGGGR